MCLRLVASSHSVVAAAELLPIAVDTIAVDTTAVVAAVAVLVVVVG